MRGTYASALQKRESAPLGVWRRRTVCRPWSDRYGVGRKLAAARCHVVLYPFDILGDRGRICLSFGRRRCCAFTVRTFAGLPFGSERLQDFAGFYNDRIVSIAEIREVRIRYGKDKYGRQYSYGVITLITDQEQIAIRHATDLEEAKQTIDAWIKRTEENNGRSD